MFNNSYTVLALASFLMHGVVLCIWLVGIYLAISRWHRHPGVSRLALIAYSLAAATTCLSFIGRFVLARTLDMQSTAIAIMVLGLAGSAVSVAVSALLLAAVFGWRNGRGTGEFERPPMSSTAVADETDNPYQSPSG